jgi:YihY family inner membrane protein
MQGLHAMVELCPQKQFLRQRLHAMVVLVLLFFTAASAIGCTSLLPKRLRRPALLFWFSLILAAFYYQLSQKHLPFSRCTIGAMVSSLGWMLVSQVFPVYIRYLSSYPQSYGIIGLMLLGIIWIQICIRLLLTGARLSYLLHAGFGNVHE